VYGLDFGHLFRGFFREGPAFFFLCFYFFIEYGRFQTIYPQIDVLPYGALSAGLAFLFLFGDRFGNIRRTSWYSQFTVVCC
jgi:hypothetical protein